MAEPSPPSALRRFLADGAFVERGGVFTDLDGTAVLEREGVIYLPPEVDQGLAAIRRLGRPVIANTLRFPLSVIRVFADDWHRAAAAPLPLVTLKGAQIGRVVRDASGAAAFEEWDAWPLTEAEIVAIVERIEVLLGDGLDDLLVFSYPRDWTLGERIWTPLPGRVAAIEAKYRSASSVASSPLAALRDTLLSRPQSMIFLLVAAPQDRLMAYQHTRPSNFFTHAGISKRSGAEAIAERMGIDLIASIGCGDAPPDDFLDATGFSIIVGGLEVAHRGRVETVRVAGIAELGALLGVLGAEVREELS